MASKTIRFQDVTEVPYGCFSVLSPHSFTIRHKVYPSVHHFFLCEKYKGTPAEEGIRTATSLWEVDRQVRKAEAGGKPVREDWGRVKTDVMLLGCYHKFKQNSDIMTTLIQTGNKYIVCSSPTDSFWGEGETGNGRNLLGSILMAVRKRLVQEEKHRRIAEQRVATGNRGGRR